MRQRYGTRPELGPVGEALVAGEVFLVDQGVRHLRVRDAVRRICDLDEGFGQLGAALEVRQEAYPELFQGFLKGFVYRV